MFYFYNFDLNQTYSTPINRNNFASGRFWYDDNIKKSCSKLQETIVFTLVDMVVFKQIFAVIFRHAESELASIPISSLLPFKQIIAGGFQIEIFTPKCHRISNRNCVL